MKVISAGSQNGNISSSVLPAGFKANFTTQAIQTGTGAGTLKWQWSNEDTPANWNDVTSGSVSITGAGNFIIAKLASCFKWLKAIYTDTFTRTLTITCVADVAKSLAGAYFQFATSGAAATKYLVWFKVSGTGSDPAIAGYTSIEVDISTNDTAATIATAINAATPGSADFTLANPSSGVFTAVQKVGGTVPVLFDGAVPTGFTLNPGTPTGALDVFFHSQDALEHLG